MRKNLNKYYQNLYCYRRLNYALKTLKNYKKSRQISITYTKKQKPKNYDIARKAIVLYEL